MKVAMVYDRVNKWGGAERVLLALHEIFPDAPLFTSVYDEKKAPWAKVFPQIHTSFLQKIPFAKSWHEGFGWLMPIVFETFSFDGYDVVISVTSEAAKGVITKPGTLHICYCLTPTRYLWSHYDLYFQNPFLRFISKPVVGYLRKWDKIAASRPDKISAISSEVKNRVKKYYGRDSVIIFPLANSSMHSNKSGKGKYYLVVSRLDYGYKKVELAIEVFNRLGEPLVIVGAGSQKSKLKSESEKNIRFVGQISETELANYYRNAKALIMPQEEDFGIVAVEAQSYGVPVIAYKKGGVLDTVIPGKTGILFEKQNVASLMQAVKKFARMSFNRKFLKDNAKRFSKTDFRQKVLGLV